MKEQYDTCGVSLHIAFPEVWVLGPGGGTGHLSVPGRPTSSDNGRSVQQMRDVE